MTRRAYPARLLAVCPHGTERRAWRIEADSSAATAEVFAAMICAVVPEFGTQEWFAWLEGAE